MALNCKKGDLALVISGRSAGVVVNCLEALPQGYEREDLPPGICQHIDESCGPLWRVDRTLTWGASGTVRLCIAPDKALMPITPECEWMPDAARAEDVNHDIGAAVPRGMP